MKGSTQDLITTDSNSSGVFTVDSSDSVSKVGQRGKTIVSFVVDEEEEQKPGKHKKERWHRTEVSYSPAQLVSILYCLMIVLVGLSSPITEAIRDNWMTQHVSAMFLVYIFVVSIVFLCYLMVMIALDKRGKKKAEDKPESDTTSSVMVSRTTLDGGTAAQGDVVLLKRQSHSSTALADLADPSSASGAEKNTTSSNGQIPPPSPTPSHLSPPPSMPHNGDNREPVCVVSRQQSVTSTSRFEEGASELNSDSVADVAEYLQLTSDLSKTHEGTSLYLRLGCLVFTIGNMVFVGLEIEHYNSNNPRCDVQNDVLTYPVYFHLAFLIVQSFFLFKVSSFHASKHKGVVSFGLMHVIATNLCVWMRFLVHEVLEGIHLAAHHDDETYAGATNSTDDDCFDEESLLLKASPYLFPFILEYSLIAVATMLGMFASLHVRISRDTFESVKRFLRSSSSSTAAAQPTKHHEDGSQITFSKAHTGTFLGFVTLAGTLISIVLFFFYVEEDDDPDTAALVYHVTDTVLHVVMIIAVVIGAARMFRMSYTLDRLNMIDNVLLVFSMIGLLLFEIFIMFSSFYRIEHDDDSDHLTVLDASAALLSVIQALLQTSFIFAGLQRYPTTEREFTQKPGRGAITFLIISNVSMWLFKMFQVKEVAIKDHLDFYGNVAWPIIMNVNLPLMLFYRFHSSVCLAEIWFSAYEGMEDSMLETSVVY